MRIALALLLLCCAAASAQVAIPALSTRVTDTTGTLDAAAIKRIEAPLAAIEASKGAQVAVLIVPTTGDETVEAYALRAFDAWNLGRKGVDDGILLVVAKNDRTVRIEVGYGLEGAVPDVSAHRVIQEYLVPRFREGDFAGGIEAAVGALGKLIEGEALPAPMSDHPSSSSGGGDFMPLFVFLIVVASVVQQLFGRLPRAARMPLMAVVMGGMARFLLGAPWWVSLLAAALGFALGMMAPSSGRVARGGGYGGMGGGSSGGGWSGGSSSRSSGGGGFSGGGGRSGGGGASGRW